jgi:hypothetical protein
MSFCTQGIRVSKWRTLSKLVKLGGVKSRLEGILISLHRGNIKRGRTRPNEVSNNQVSGPKSEKGGRTADMLVFEWQRNQKKTKQLAGLAQESQICVGQVYLFCHTYEHQFVAPSKRTQFEAGQAS